MVVTMGERKREGYWYLVGRGQEGRDPIVRIKTVNKGLMSIV